MAPQRTRSRHPSAINQGLSRFWGWPSSQPFNAEEFSTCFRQTCGLYRLVQRHALLDNCFAGASGFTLRNSTCDSVEVSLNLHVWKSLETRMSVTRSHPFAATPPHDVQTKQLYREAHGSKSSTNMHSKPHDCLEASSCSSRKE